jgi:hypothetical protein
MLRHAVGLADRQSANPAVPKVRAATTGAIQRHRANAAIARTPVRAFVFSPAAIQGGLRDD